MARALADSVDNAQFVSCSELEKKGKKALAEALGDPSVTYFLDEPDFMKPSTWHTINDHLQAGGKAVCFLERRKDASKWVQYARKPR